MAAQDYVLQIADANDADVVTLTSSPFGIRANGYVMNAPRPEDVDTLTEDATVTETAMVKVLDGSMDNNIDEINALERLFVQAKEAQSNSAVPPVYVKYKNKAAGTLYRSEVIGGRIQYDKKTLGPSHWARDATEVAVSWRRRYFWEENDRVILTSLINHLESGGASSIQIYNPAIAYTAADISCVDATDKVTAAAGLDVFLTGDTIYLRGTTGNDGTYTVTTGGVATEIVLEADDLIDSGPEAATVIGAICNYIEIDSTDLVAAAPGRIELVLKNETGGAVQYPNIYVGHGVYPTPADLDYIVQADSGTPNAPAQESADASDGIYVELTISDVSLAEIWFYQFTPEQVQAMGGGYFHVLGRFVDGTLEADTYLRLRIEEPVSGSTIWTGAQTQMVASNKLQIIGVVPIPPPALWRLRIANPVSPLAVVTLAIDAYRSGAGTLNLDCLQITSIHSWRHLEQIGTIAIGDDHHIIINEYNTIRGQTYGLTADPNFSPYVAHSMKGTPIRLVPDVTQRLYIMHDGESAGLDSALAVSVFWRGRKLSF